MPDRKRDKFITLNADKDGMWAVASTHDDNIIEIDVPDDIRQSLLTAVEWMFAKDEEENPEEWRKRTIYHNLIRILDKEKGDD